MAWVEYLFGLKGNIGRVRMWATLLICSALGEVVGFLAHTRVPVTVHAITFNKNSVAANSTTYEWPSGPTDVLGWILFSGNYVIGLTLAWIVIAAAVRRLHDVGGSGKELVILFLGFCVVAAIGEAIDIPPPSSTLSIPAVLWMLCLAPLALYGLKVIVSIFYLPGTPPGAGIRSFEKTSS